MSVRISSEFVRGMTTSIQYEAATKRQEALNETARSTAAAWISPTYRPLTFVTQNNYSSTGGVFGGGNTTVNHIVNNPTHVAKGKKEKEEDSAQTAVIVGSILSVIGAALVGYGYSLVTAQRESLHMIRDVRDALYNGERGGVSREVLNDFARLVTVQQEIDELNTQKITHYFLAAVGMLAGGVALASGGFMMVPVLMTAGKITLLLSAVGGALNWGLHCNDDRKISKNYMMILGDQSRGIQGLADRILSALHAEQAPEGRGASHAYVPLVPGTYVSGGPISSDCPPVKFPDYPSNKDLDAAARAAS